MAILVTIGTSQYSLIFDIEVTFFCKTYLCHYVHSFVLGVTENSQVCTGDITLSSSCH